MSDWVVSNVSRVQYTFVNSVIVNNNKNKNSDLKKMIGVSLAINLNLLPDVKNGWH